MIEKLLIVEDEFIVANDLTNMMENAGYNVCGTADSVESAKAAIDKYQPTWVLLDIFLQDDSMGTELAPYLQEKGIGFIYISANTNQSILEAAKATQPYGFLVKPFREKDLLIMLDIARSKHETSLQFTAQRELLLQQQVRALTDEQTTLESKLNKIPATFQSLIPFDYLAFSYTPANSNKPESGAFFRVGFNEYQVLPALEAKQLIQVFYYQGSQTQIRKSVDASILNGGAFHSFQAGRIPGGGLLAPYRLNSSLQLLNKTSEGTLQLAFFNRNENGFDHSHKTLLCKNEKFVFRLFNTLSLAYNGDSKTLRRASRNQPVKSVPKFEGIYGNSAALLHVLDNVEMVADTPVTVLILGESGTGKEKIAHNIHLLSSRQDAPFITVNCAAIPADLIESELFGHEKGAFTGAIEKRIGKFEAANGGTIFLDEIGELPLESQVKLLRVLQERQFEHIGSSKTIKVDVRIVAATNRNLEKEVGEGRFRLDLFYRLNVYPINLPPLRERKEDIPVLARYFLSKSAEEMGRLEAPELSPAALKQLSVYNWPGNIRELNHLMERTLIKTRGKIVESIEMPAVTRTDSIPATSTGDNRKTLEQIEAEHILSVLKSCNGKVTGVGGAAEILGLPPSTLTSRMKKLGIKKELYHDR
ncbi:response regulator [Mucilaginibacter rubeus]|uniref:Response regulator n=1 Tax=Mucilaginibacter rubeus TaxID=2027860 RepID=A0AAE6JBZ5_9SPHI|nr:MULTISPECIES: sigma 54-interacting transcriptional regulator [Mucilaginibacter]QEM02696.1 response regulator [Mucilaginibacter rubeus]QEM15315.1 response regulator [Mucilaginibacter gossypii]QTE41956.1 sigma 54-interacting transcriptional regulator [Mucilaginibacter rubeus]QTE48558.1 sigma 54-interacting transcriptional regulator [Mucilaginibacter rubeus]QTE59944.1 sigma 54-interacting transcriptional regulator [Mucilaginibacter rubeus]